MIKIYRQTSLLARLIRAVCAGIELRKTAVLVEGKHLLEDATACPGSGRCKWHRICSV
jgi:hypothetical protein